MIYGIDDKRGQEKSEILARMQVPEFPSQRFSVIMADPPWFYQLREKDKTHRNRCPYPPMKTSEIIALPVASIAEQHSYLLLWVTKDHLLSGEGASVCNAWGFTPKGLHTWEKICKDGSIRQGVGHYGRNCAEHIIVATRKGTPSWTKLGIRDVPTVFRAQRGEHSAKPPEFYPVAERLSDALGGIRVELFARKPRDGWSQWGTELIGGSLDVDRAYLESPVPF